MGKTFRIDFVLFGLVVSAALAGIFTLYAQESVLDESPGRFFRQVVFFGIGLVVCFALRKLQYSTLGDYALPLYAVAIVLLLITLIPGIGSESKGARSWIRFGAFGFQSSEVAKLCTVILLAKYLELKEKEMFKLPSLIIPFMIAMLPMMLIVVQPDFGGAFSLAPILMSMLFVAGADIYHISSVLMFFGVSISIPLYIEYHKITMIDPLKLYLAEELQKPDLLPVVPILNLEVWKFIDNGLIPASVADQDRSYLLGILNNPNLLQDLQEAAAAVRYKSGGLLLLVLENITLLVVLGSIMALVALVLVVLRYTQGRSLEGLRKAYIPLGVLGVSLLAATTFHTAFSFKYHQVVRVTAFVSPEKFPRDLAYQIRASKAAIGSGQVVGRGFFEGDMTMGDRPLVPEAYTDFIFTAWSERVGFLGAVVLLLILIGIPLRSLQLSFEARDRFGSLLASGIAFMFFYHIALNTGIALGLLPVTGIPLSFVSYGGSHLVTCMAGVGILLSIYRRRFAN